MVSAHDTRMGKTKGPRIKDTLGVRRLVRGGRRVLREPALADLHEALHTATWVACGQSLRLLRLEGPGEQSPLAALRPGAASSWLEHVWPWDVARVSNFLLADVAEVSPVLEYRISVAGGTPLWVRHWLFGRVERGSAVELRGVLQAIAPQQQIHTVCLDLAEEERSRIGQELHDDVCQVLAGVNYMMKVVTGRARKVAPALGRELEDLTQCLAEAMNRTRAMSHALFHKDEHEACLRSALGEVALRAEARFGVPIGLHFPARLPAHSPEQVAQVVRILHDALADAIRARKATEVAVHLSPAPGGLELRVEDNGHELYSACVRSELRIARYRAEFLGGDLTVDGSGDRPTLRLFYPIPRISRKNAQAA